MSYGYGFGRGYGRGLGQGFGFRGSSPPWPYVGRGRGGLPRCWAYAAPPYGEAWGPPYYGEPPFPGATPYAPKWNKEDELNFLKEEAAAVKNQLDEIEKRIKGLEDEEK